MKWLIFTLLMLVSILPGAGASLRTDAIFGADVGHALDELKEKQGILRNNKNALLAIDRSLRTTHKGQTVYLQLKKIGGSVLLIGVVVGSYKAYFPPGFRAMLGAYVTVNGMSHGMIRLNEKDINELLVEIGKIKEVIKSHEIQIAKRIQFFCRHEPRHQLCY